MLDRKSEAIALLNDALKELESAKGSVTVGVQKLSRASFLLEDKTIYVWSEIQLGNQRYIYPLKELFEFANKEYEKTKKTVDINNEKVEKILTTFKDEGVDYKFILTSKFVELKDSTSTGGLDHSINILEDQLPYLKKNGNDKTLYLTNVQKHIDYIKKKAHEYCVMLSNKYKYSDTSIGCFDLLKNAVDDKLLDLEPELAQQLMLAFKGISSKNSEEWSQALTSCRRLLEALADKLYPPNNNVINKRTFKANQYINRLWQFMSESIESESNRDLAKMHVDYLGSWLEKNYKMTNKGVHAEVSQLEATRVVFHMYLMLSDILEYLDPSQISNNSKPSLKNATLDDFEVRLNVKREIAKAIYKVRIEKNGSLTFDDLNEIRGIGVKTLQLAKEQFSE
ncbi:helix-hairpin-helix domain-containing protein [Acinetobacter sp. 187]|uniref:helix-hairpin-helix domain-containing protein n=1 Tax=Acinetobacter lanii TaxID=2715163 RepID=UPI00140E7708|nr:helix-hairpin-helix domain-containing protein [Acinetobacter lanii]NHC04333.1 helix-hairpin-helix domain-containing protein [Acinetobacter lanii]